MGKESRDLWANHCFLQSRVKVFKQLIDHCPKAKPESFSSLSVLPLKGAARQKKQGKRMRVKAMQTPDLFCKAKWSCTAADKWIDATEVFSPFPATANNVVPAIICVVAQLDESDLGWKSPSSGVPLRAFPYLGALFGCPVPAPKLLLLDSTCSPQIWVI